MTKHTIERFPTTEEMAERAAERFAALAAQAIEERGVFVAALSGGGTPEPLYRRLAQPPYSERINWQRVHLFWADERVVPPDADGSNYKQVRELLLDSIELPPDNVWRVHGEYEADRAALDYLRQLEAFAAAFQVAEQSRWPIFDLVLLGIGTDGHTASIFPYAPFCTYPPVRAVEADYGDRPAQRITLTEAVLNDARHVIFLVSGQEKAAIVKTVVEGPDNSERYPAQRVQPQNGTLTLMVDEAAAARLTQLG